MQGNNDSRSIWSRLGHIFGREEDETLERAIIDARADGEVAPEEESMLLGVLRFNTLKVQDAMTPRADIDSLPKSLSVQDAAKVVVATGHTRLLVIDGNLDNIVGVVHAKDVLRCLTDPQKIGQPVTVAMREPFFVPETKKLPSLLQEFQAGKQQMAVALDEYGGTSGIISIEDVLEEIVGEIQDEHDKPVEEDIRDLGNGTYELSGRAYLEDLADIGVEIESDEVDTIGGYLSTEAGHVPTPGERVAVKEWTFTVLDADKKRVKRLRLKMPEAGGEAGKN